MPFQGTLPQILDSFWPPSRNCNLPPKKKSNRPRIFLPEIWWQGLDYRLWNFGFGPSNPELGHFSFVLLNANLHNFFFPLFGKILVLRALPAYRKIIGCLPNSAWGVIKILENFQCFKIEFICFQEYPPCKLHRQKRCPVGDLFFLTKNKFITFIEPL